MEMHLFELDFLCVCCQRYQSIVREVALYTLGFFYNMERSKIEQGNCTLILCDTKRYLQEDMISHHS